MLTILVATGLLTARGCIDLRGPGSEVSLRGRLTLETFPGPPNYESVRRGDAAEHAYILEMERDICIDDGGEFADPEERFRHVQLYSARRPQRQLLSAARGQWVRVRGAGFGAHTGHHHASLVVDVRALRIEGR
ncbi:MAG: hypothetical protein QOJ53_592 [Sphingomonadales bacterium]|jgi:hypothetical protein|nr:hypothetical protein [Sphingomonadales bacterium]MEA3043334.1 hypothetical protein [Sphingomonadales bacterium]MEA3046260.1 hypothetical protein [Sphingomonadales bacterium]